MPQQYRQTTSYSPRSDFENVIGAAKGLGTLIGGVADLRKQGRESAVDQALLEAKRRDMGFEIYSKSGENRDYNMMTKALTDYLGVPAGAATKYVESRRKADETGDNKISNAFENIGLLHNGQYRMPSGEIKTVTPEEASVLLPQTMYTAEIDPQYWTKPYEAMYGEEGYKQLNIAHDKLFEQQLFNLKNILDQGPPTLDTTKQVAALGAAHAITKAKNFAAWNKVTLPDDFGQSVNDEIRYREAERKLITKKPLSPYEDKLYNESRRKEEEHIVKIKETKAKTVLDIAKERESATNILLNLKKLQEDKKVSAKDKLQGYKIIAEAKKDALLIPDQNTRAKTVIEIERAEEEWKKEVGINVDIPEGAILMTEEEKKKLKPEFRSKMMFKTLSGELWYP